MNIPLLVAGCGVEKGVHTDAMVSSVDIAPMICALMGAQPLPFANGVSPFSPQGELLAPRSECLIEYRVGYVDRDTASFGIVNKDWKYVRHQTGEEELVDRVNDPNEHHSLIDAAHQEKRTEMALRMLDMIIASGAKGPKQLCHG